MTALALRATLDFREKLETSCGATSWIPMNVSTSELGIWSPTVPYEQRLILPGACIAPGIAMSMLRMAVGASSNVICKGDGKRETNGDAPEIAAFRLAYLERLSDDEW